MKRFLSLLSVCVIFISCSSTPEPVDTNSNLVIGKIILAANGYGGYGHVTVDGIRKNGIKISVVNIKTGDFYLFVSESTGMYHSVNMPAGEYFIQGYLYNHSSENSSSEIRYSPDEKIVFKISSGSVNNLGVIKWLSDNRNGVSVQYNNEYSAVYNEFIKSKKHSLWTKYEWINVSVGNRTDSADSPLMHMIMQPLYN